ncbi:MAG TPA: hypothetical protein VM759_12320, partial [Longimicrobium sp.]|nr:hypothetical protein [Longimicrobium sp.]
MSRLARTVVLLSALSGLAACREEVSPWDPERIARMPLREQVGQMIASAVYIRPDARPATDTVLARRLAASGVGGVRLLPGSAAVAARRVAVLQSIVRRPLLVIADLDRGAGGALAGTDELPPPAFLAAWGAEHVAEGARRAAEEARAAGVNFAMLSAPSFPYLAPLPGAVGSGADSAFAAYAQALAEAGLVVGVRTLSPGERGDVGKGRGGEHGEVHPDGVCLRRRASCPFRHVVRAPAGQEGGGRQLVHAGQGPPPRRGPGPRSPAAGGAR